MFLPINVNDKQRGNSSWFIPNRADCVPALLSRYSIDTIWNDQASLVLEDESGQLEGDCAVVPLISEILGLVPFTARCIYRLYHKWAARCGEAVRAAHMEAVGLFGNSAAQRQSVKVDSGALVRDPTGTQRGSQVRAHSIPLSAQRPFNFQIAAIPSLQWEG